VKKEQCTAGCDTETSMTHDACNAKTRTNCSIRSPYRDFLREKVVAKVADYVGALDFLHDFNLFDDLFDIFTGDLKRQCSVKRRSQRNRKIGRHSHRSLSTPPVRDFFV
jgi:hypothetical protein